MSNSGLNCCRDWKKVPANRWHCWVISVIAGKCMDGSCTWNMDRANGRCLYEGRSVKNNNTGDRRIYLPDGYVERKTEVDAISLACPKCDIKDTCDRLPDVVARAKGGKECL